MIIKFCKKERLIYKITLGLVSSGKEPESWPGHPKGFLIVPGRVPSSGLLDFSLFFFEVVGAFHFSGDLLGYVYYFIKHGFDSLQLFRIKCNLQGILLECRKSLETVSLLSSINFSSSYLNVAKVLLLRQSTNV